MLTEDQRRQIEMNAAEQIRSELIARREAWGTLHTHRVRGLIDDLRATIVEEPWFGKPVSERLNDVTRMVYEPDHYNVLGTATDKVQDLIHEFYGYEDQDKERSAPEIEHDR